MKATSFLQMTLHKDMLTKALKKQRTTAVSLLNQLTAAGKLPELVYQYESGGTPKRPSHFCRVKFRVPRFILDSKTPDGDDIVLMTNSMIGSGRCTKKVSSKSLAALEVILRLEEEMRVPNGWLLEKLDGFINAQQEKQKELESIPVTQETPGVSFDNIPFDMCFSENNPGGRLGTIDFLPELKADSIAFTAAKAIILTSQNGLPKLETHTNNVQEAAPQKYTNIKAEGRISGVVGPSPDGANYELDPLEATILALKRIGANLMKRMGMSENFRAFMKASERGDSSFGMAKLFVNLPKYQFDDLNLLISKAKPYSRETFEPSAGSSEEPVRSKIDITPSTEEEKKRRMTLEKRITTLRKFQQRTSLPVDNVESQIYDNRCSVTIIRGGTGSGKTTRYPLMLSLFSPTGDRTKVIVSQPRRIACQTAANRVASEQDYRIGNADSPVGYAIRFESKLSAPDALRTVDFMTPGLMLRRATNDALFSNYTHLCIDEIHERNADMDLLLALGKKAMRSRLNHPTLEPLQLILMSATLDIDQWEKYFRDDDPNISIKVIDVPDVRRYDIETVHLGESRFPIHQTSTKKLLYQRNIGEGFDEELCAVAAEVISHLILERRILKNSLLCFLPGLEEIRMVHKLINEQPTIKNGPRVVYLHSSVSSQDQARAFEPGPKIILATNIAETSITIPDVQIVVDSGRERQSSLFESASESETVSVVGSQLVTVNISKASAKQRTGRSGRVMAGTCYRLYTRAEYESMESFAMPEMLRMELSQLVLHSISLYNPKEEHPLCLLLTAPDPPTEQRLRQTLRSLAFQGLVDVRDDECFENFTMTRDADEEDEPLEATINLTPLGRAVSALPISPRLGRMLFLGLVLRAIDPAITIAALLSVPKAFSPPPRHLHNRELKQGTSDIVARMEDLEKFLHMHPPEQRLHPMRAVYSQVMRVRQQIEQAMKSYIERNSQSNDEVNWNANSNRVAAIVGLICCATPYIAHLTGGRSDFATRDLPGTAKMHPSSLNFAYEKRAHWYVYNELRVTKEPFLMVTTAASPLDLALFTDASTRSEEFDGVDVLQDFYSDNDWLFVADQWVPVVTKNPSQRQAIRKLRRLLTYDMLQYVSIDPVRFASGELYEHIVLFALSAVERQRIQR
jgi:HrpA-like RNA helicase